MSEEYMVNAQMRLEALKQAISFYEFDTAVEDIIKAANQFYIFLKGATNE